MPEGGASRGAVHLQLDIPALQIEDETTIQLCSEYVIVHELDGYSMHEGRATKQLGRRLGIYHPITSSISLLNDFEWDIFDHLATSSPVISIRDLKFHYNGTFVQAEQAIESFRQAGLILEEEERFDLHIRQQFQTSELYVNTTQMCNFACPGCATAADVIPLNAALTLDQSTIGLYLRQFARSCDERGVSEARIKWAGGEPLLKKSFDQIVAAQGVVEELRRQYPDIDFYQTILTNGSLLNDDKIAFAKAYDIHVSVSLWGIGELQDTMRRPRGKQATFPIIIEAVRALHEAGVRYNVNHVLTPDNAAHFPDFISMMWDVEHPTFIAANWLDPRPIPLGINFFRPQHASQRSAIAEGYRRMEDGLRHGFARILDMIQRGIDIPPLNSIDYLDLFTLTVTPCGTGFNYVAVGPQGAAPCHEDLYQMAANLERIHRGENLFDVANERYQHNRDLLLGQNITFEGSSILNLHGGQGCPRLASTENGGQLGVAASTSRLYLAIYEELLSLEAMRQLALHAHG